MIAFRVEIWCDGCGRHCGPGIANDDIRALEPLALDLTEFAGFAGWTIDGAAHWCPRCTHLRTRGPVVELERLPVNGGVQ